jgi:L-ascorbate metabolism protein UlaG (beta-lactamase superfamily)
MTRLSRAGLVIASVLSLSACGSDGAPAQALEPAAPPAQAPAETPRGSCERPSCAPPVAEEPAPSPSALRVRFLGVGGFAIEHGGETVLTAPLFTRASMVQVSTGLPVTSDAALVAKGLASTDLAHVRAVLSGHAHYDHLLDVPAAMGLAPQATLYANRSAKNLLAAFAPDRDAKCAGAPASSPAIARSRVVALDDPGASTVDYRSCPEKRPPGAPLDGRWVRVPGSHVRVLAVCSEHPDQVGPFHFAPGDVTEEQCTPPSNMTTWKEGLPLAYLVDFLDPETDAPIFRVYYQDSPTNAPIGHAPAPLLADKRVDLALLCVGTYDSVDDAPTKTLGALRPRYALGGHWEDFFRSTDAPPQPIPFLDVATWGTRARMALPASGEPRILVQNGKPETERAVLPQPGDTFEISRGDP